MSNLSFEHRCHPLTVPVHRCNDKLFPPTTAEPPKTKPFAASATDSKAASPSSASARGCCGDGPDEAFDDLQHHSSAFLPQVLLIDAGCEVAGGYASDVTRTMPIGNGGKFTKEGREIYQLVLDMQKASPRDFILFCLELMAVICRRSNFAVELACIGMISTFCVIR